MGDKIVFNIGGGRFETYLETITQRLGNPWLERVKNIAKLEDAAGTLFIDRSPKIFDSIIDYCRTGQFHLPLNLCGSFITQELEFWNIRLDLIEPCCWSPFSTDDQLKHEGEHGT